MSREPMGANTGSDQLADATSIVYDNIDGSNYFITIKPTYNSNKKYCQDHPHQLMNVLTWILPHNYELIDSVYEFDSKKVPHIHVIVNTNENIIPKLKGWHIFIEECQNIQKVKSYLSKDRIDLSEYAFQDDIQ